MHFESGNVLDFLLVNLIPININLHQVFLLTSTIQKWMASSAGDFCISYNGFSYQSSYLIAPWSRIRPRNFLPVLHIKEASVAEWFRALVL